MRAIVAAAPGRPCASPGRRSIPGRGRPPRSLRPAAENALPNLVPAHEERRVGSRHHQVMNKVRLGVLLIFGSLLVAVAGGVVAASGGSLWLAGGILVAAEGSF